MTSISLMRLCQDCTEDLEHCHDTLVVHIDGTVECVESACDVGSEGHDWMATCIDLGWNCICSRTGHSQPLAA